MARKPEKRKLKKKKKKEKNQEKKKKKKRKPGLEVIKLFLCSTQLIMKFILLINVKMLTTVGILTFISRMYTSYESLKARNTYLFQRFTFYERLKLYALLSMKNDLSPWDLTLFHATSKHLSAFVI